MIDLLDAGRAIAGQCHLVRGLLLGPVHQWPHMSPQDRSGFDATQDTILGLAILGQFVIAVFAGYAAILLAVGAVVFSRRDA
jgi:ABC-type transport system involved in multi-copper enzyme maturation permease subunit